MKPQKIFIAGVLTAAIVLCAVTACLHPTGGRGGRDRRTVAVADLNTYAALARARYVRYLTCADRASSENDKLASGLFRALAQSARIHETSCTQALRLFGEQPTATVPKRVDVAATCVNLRKCIADERRCLDTVRGAAVTRSIASGNNYAARIFIWVDGCNRRHVELLERCLYDEGNDSLCRCGREYSVCPTCGNVYESDNRDVYCPFCRTHHTQFMRFGTLQLD
ncbi:MAG: hypothetical protein J6K28_03980 [Alistipes sp.]|nr:hypothetical protein [Alistipes sp.]